MRLPIVLAVLASTALPVLAAAPSGYYLDDRSSAPQLLRSFYNAVNRKDFARAWDYFGDQKPAPDFKTFVDGYAKTESVRVRVGEPVTEGTAGSAFFNVPVAIEAIDAGAQTVFAGCYTLRQVDPAIQEPPFQPLSIERASLKKSDDYFEDALPASCDGSDAAADPKAMLIEQAKTLFRAAHADTCDVFMDGVEPATPEPDYHVIRFRPTGSEPNSAEEEVQLMRFYCGAGAYNETHIYYLASEIEGVQELHFARPELDIHYENDNYEGKVEGIDIVGFQADAPLVNSDYDPEAKMISDFSKWRGIGDASSNGIWRFENGRFVLVKFDVDATYDGEINPETIYEAKP